MPNATPPASKEESLLETIARKFIEHMKNFSEEAETIIASYGQLPQNVKAKIDSLNIDLYELEHDPGWRSWKRDDMGRCSFPCEEGCSGWIRVSKASINVLALVDAMKRQQLNSVSLGLFEYKLSGQDFLQRRALKKPDENDAHARMQRNISNVKKTGEKSTS